MINLFFNWSIIWENDLRIIIPYIPWSIQDCILVCNCCSICYPTESHLRREVLIAFTTINNSLNIAMRISQNISNTFISWSITWLNIRYNILKFIDYFSIIMITNSYTCLSIPSRIFYRIISQCMCRTRSHIYFFFVASVNVIKPYTFWNIRNF